MNDIFAPHRKTLRGSILEPCIPGGQWLDDKYLLYPMFNGDDLVKFVEYAPCPEELCLSARRSLGDKTECQLYEVPGKFPALCSLILNLDCNLCDSVVRDWNQFPEQTPKLPIYNVFMPLWMRSLLKQSGIGSIQVEVGGN
jgi:hypothetical protein